MNMSMLCFGKRCMPCGAYMQLGAPQAKKILDVSSGFECGFNGLSRPSLPTPCHLLLTFPENGLLAFVN